MNNTFQKGPVVLWIVATFMIQTTSAWGQYRLNISPNCVFTEHASRGTVSIPECDRLCCHDLDCRRVIVNLSHFPPHAHLQYPSQLIIDRAADGPESVSFDIQSTAPVFGHTSLTATFKRPDGSTLDTDTVGFDLLPGGMLDDLTLDPGSVIGGTLSTGTVHLQCEADERRRGWIVAVSSSDPSLAIPEDNIVRVPAGQSDKDFLITTQPVLQPTDVTITASSSGVTVQRTLHLIPGSVDLWIRNIEITQGIQYLDDAFGHADNSLPLVRRRPTAVRVYLATNSPATINPVPVSLKSRRTSDPPNAWVTHSPLWPYAQINSVISATQQRASPSNQTDLAGVLWNATFLIDPSYLPEGTRIFRAEVNPGHLIVEANYNNNVYTTAPILFRGTRDLNVKFVKIDWCPDCPFDHNPQHKPSWSHRLPMIQHAQKILPFDEVHHWKAGREVNVTYFTPNNFRKEAAWGYVLTSLAAMKAFTDDEAGNMHYYGLLDDDVPNGDTCGMAWLPPNPTVALGSTECDPWTFVHEIGHNLGREHAPCGDPDNPDPNWPEDSNPDTAIGHTGFDFDSHLTVNGATHRDFMSYCGPEWISPYTYKQIMDEILPASQSPVGEMSDHVVVRGVFNEEGTLFVPPMYRRPLPAGSHDQEGIGTHSVELRSKDGRMLGRRFYTPEMADAAAGTAFFEILPYSAEASEIHFMVPGPNGPELAATTPVSAVAPIVRVVGPNGGESFGSNGTLTVHWEGSDSDNDPLFYMVQYSRDGGIAWETLALDLPVTTFDIELADIAGSDAALIRVIASDGVNNASDVADDVFQIASKPPEVAILAPHDRKLFPADSPVLLRCTATDTEDGPLMDEQLTWTSHLDGLLGAGKSLTAVLSPGVHHITLAAEDSEGRAASASISLAVRIIGDCDGDSLVSLLDLQSAPACLSGPSGSPLSPECACLDLNSDGHVDLFDISYLQLAFTGSP